jgi:AAA ATPase domain
MSDRVEASSQAPSLPNRALAVDAAPSAVSGLVGRAREQEELDRLLADARRGRSGCLVVRGEAGMGKTALLGYTVDRADDFTVLRTSGIEAEYDLAFAGLRGLLWPIVERLPELPEPHLMRIAVLADVHGWSTTGAPSCPRPGMTWPLRSRNCERLALSSSKLSSSDHSSSRRTPTR